MKTTTDQKTYLKRILFYFAVIAVVGAAALGVYTRNVAAALFVGGVCLLTGVIMMLIIGKKPPVQLEFSGAELHIRDSNGGNYVVYDVPASDFVCRQSKSQREKDQGDLQVKNTRFYFYGVHHYSQVCAYIRENFPEG